MTSTGGVGLNAEANLTFNGSTLAVTGAITTTGNVTVGGVLTENSSLRYKKDIETLKYGLEIILQLRGVRYVRKDNGITEIGVIAEEIDALLPEIVLRNDEGQVDSVSYGRLSAIFIEAIKELKHELMEQSHIINEQNLIINELKRKLDL
jgi:hypothetical protein